MSDLLSKPERAALRIGTFFAWLSVGLFGLAFILLLVVVAAFLIG